MKLIGSILLIVFSLSTINLAGSDFLQVGHHELPIEVNDFEGSDHSVDEIDYETQLGYYRICWISFLIDHYNLIHVEPPFYYPTIYQSSIDRPPIG